MPDVEKVIKGLECCLKADVNDCEMDCPYFNDCGGIYSNNTALMTDALALLKAQEPRVIKPEELRNGGIVVWYEVKGEEPCPCIVGEYDRDSRYFMGSTGCGETTISEWEEYNIKWRCWTSRPTEEQREKEPWNG